MNRFLVMILCLFFSLEVFSEISMERLRDDLDIPTYCSTVKVSHFKKNINQIKYFTYGSKGSTAHGFDYEVSIPRKTATKIWSAYKKGKDLLSLFQSDPLILGFVKTILRDIKRKKYDLYSEGEILESLALEDLKKYYSEDLYFFTGGVSYSRNSRTNTLGELDLIVAKKKDCTVVAVGESKLGLRLGKAKAQLKRFQMALQGVFNY